MFLFRIIRRVINAILLMVIVLPLFVSGKIWMTAKDAVISKSDVILILGAAQFDGRPSAPFEARLGEAKRIFDLGFAPTIFTVGAGAPGDRTTEAASAKNWLIRNGLRKSQVIAIEKGRDTFVSTESYIALMKTKGMQSVIIVTDPYHCLRAMTMARDMGAKPLCSPVRKGENSLEHFNLQYLIRETGAYLAYITLGRRGIHVSDHLGRE